MPVTRSSPRLTRRHPLYVTKTDQEKANEFQLTMRLKQLAGPKPKKLRCPCNNPNHSVLAPQMLTCKTSDRFEHIGRWFQLVSQIFLPNHILCRLHVSFKCILQPRESRCFHIFDLERQMTHEQIISDPKVQDALAIRRALSDVITSPSSKKSRPSLGRAMRSRAERQLPVTQTCWDVGNILDPMIAVLLLIKMVHFLIKCCGQLLTELLQPDYQDALSISLCARHRGKFCLNDHKIPLGEHGIEIPGVLERRESPTSEWEALPWSKVISVHHADVLYLRYSN